MIGGATRAATQHNQLCVGTLEHMSTDSRALFAAGLQLSTELWREASLEFDWNDLDCYVSHQISKVHTSAICRAVGIDPAKAPSTFQLQGNIGPAAVPSTLAHVADSLETGNRVLLMGIGSGLNACILEIQW